MIITSDTAFFERLGWKKGEETPYAVMEFFNRCYEFALQEFGYHGTDKNILSAVIHVDEKTPHLQLYYIPVVDTAKKKVYEKGADGKYCGTKKARLFRRKTSAAKAFMSMCRWNSRSYVARTFGANAAGSYPTVICRIAFTSK